MTLQIFANFALWDTISEIFILADSEPIEMSAENFLVKPKRDLKTNSSV